jgi:hypothetical protein
VIPIRIAVAHRFVFEFLFILVSLTTTRSLGTEPSDFFLATVRWQCRMIFRRIAFSGEAV